MRRDVNDLPEIFRRFLEEESFTDEDDRPTSPGQPPPGGGRRPRSPFQPWWNNTWFWVSILLLILLFSFNWIVSTYTDWLWFNALDYPEVWLKQWGVQLASFGLFFLIAATVLLVNWFIARRAALTLRSGRQAPIPAVILRWLILAVAVFLAYIFGTAAASQWEEFLRYWYQVPFGIADPLFNRDISFYVFELPVYRFLQGWLLPLLILALLGVVGLYALGSLRVGDGPPRAGSRERPLTVSLPSLESDAFRRHVAILAALILALWAVGYAFSIFGLNYARGGVVFGAGYTDANATLPALWAQLALMALLALAVLYNVIRFDWRPVAAVAGLWLAATILLGGVYPAIVQRYDVEPSELQRERPYLENNIAYTRLAYDLDDVATVEFGNVTELAPSDLAQNEETLRNIRLWDYRPLQQTYTQLQALRPYYQFGELDIDRYEIDDLTRQVMLGARELNKAELPSQSWVNRNLQFTHGYGVVMNPVDLLTPEGRPVFYIQDLPPRSVVDIEVDRPEIYYGELMDDVVYVGSLLEEFDYPSGDENVYSSYEGEGGVELSNLLRRLAFAFRFGDINLLLSEYIDDETRVMFHRQIARRASRIAPFLTLDPDPYLVVADGRLVWIIDAYTASNLFPYSEPFEATGAAGVTQRLFQPLQMAEGVNYIRNAVKLTVDAYNGDVNFYIANNEDPIIQTYNRAFPGLFRPLEEMPAPLQAHIRYPELLFIIQAQQYLTYHMTDPQVFYNREDLWSIPLEVVGDQQQPMEPYYVLLSLRGEEETEYLLIQPYTPANRNNMIAWLAGRSDQPNYGELVAYELPKQELIFGPIQVEGRIDQSPEISEQISLWDQIGSQVLRGNLLVIPLNESFLYVEPLYLISQTSSLPELKRVILASGDQVVMRPTLAEALAALVEGAPAVTTVVPDIETDVGEPPTPEEAEVIAAVDETVQELITSANAHFEAAEAALREGDWSTYGLELEALQEDLEQLTELTGE